MMRKYYYFSTMKAVNVRLSDEEHEKLAKVKQQTGMSINALIRQAVRDIKEEIVR